MKLIKTTITSTLLALLLSGSAIADCSYELFSISSTKNTKIIDFVEQLSDECDFSIIVTDPNAEAFLNTKLNKTNLNNLTIDEVFNIILKENNLSYTLENNLLRISYLTTKMFGIDYILSTRASKGTTDITLSSGEDEGSGGDTGSTTGGTTVSATSESGVTIETKDEVIFWKNLDKEFQSILNRPEDIYVAEAPIINKNAGIITVTATLKQMNRLEKYLKNLQDKVQLQVLIDVQLLSVQMSDGRTTGVDWNQLFALQNVNVNYGNDLQTGTTPNTRASHVTLTSASGLNLNQVVKFLKTQGDVSSISNPKVLTLNNQPALITAGTEYFYKITSTETLAGAGTGAQSASENVQSIFAGVLLDITPEISDDDTITLKINPSLSETTNSQLATTDAAERTMPPDLNRRQLSSVVTVKDGNKVILGGLITTTNSVNSNSVPILGDIPVIDYFFKYEEMTKSTQELIIVIEPHIIKKEKNDISLSDLGYEGISDTILKNGSSSIVQTTNNFNSKEENER